MKKFAFVLSLLFVFATNAFAIKLPGSSVWEQARDGHGETIYHQNGSMLTSDAGKVGATWYHPGGSIASSWAGQKGATWYFSNGSIATSWAGTIGATWYYPSGAILTTNAGVAGATWYNPDGSIFTNNGRAMTEDELMYPPCSILLADQF